MDKLEKTLAKVGPATSFHCKINLNLLLNLLVESHYERSHSSFFYDLMLNICCVKQKGEDAAVIETKKKEMEAKRAAAASCKGAKVYYKITVRV